MKEIKESKEGKIFSNPKINVLDGKKATASIISEEPYLEKVEIGLGIVKIGKNSTMDDLEEIKISQGEGLYTWKVMELGFKLDVLPVIKDNNKIMLDIDFEFSELERKKGLPDAPEIKWQPVVNTRSVVTQVLINPGETFYTGGVKKQNKKNPDLLEAFFVTAKILD